jgi:hypothetical protein
MHAPHGQLIDTVLQLLYFPEVLLFVFAREVPLFLRNVQCFLRGAACGVGQGTGAGEGVARAPWRLHKPPA